ncbi:Fungal specific transcription factor domain [Ceratobasidium sp. AG-Ba]|nr:Fungal specific transcription factor domain [Ceratobasidium sp. AG-Ba]
METRKYATRSPATNGPGSSKSPILAESPPEAQPMGLDYSFESELDTAGSVGYELPLILGDEWPANLPSRQLVNHLVDLFFNCYPNSRRVVHRPTFLSSLLESPSSPRFPYIGLLHAICAAGAVYSSLVTAAPQPVLSNRPAEELFSRKTHTLDGRVLAFDEEQFLLAKYLNMDFANKGEHLLEVVQGKSKRIESPIWAKDLLNSLPHQFLGNLASRLSVALGLNLSDTMQRPLPSYIREQLLISPPQSHVDVELRRNVFWLVYALQRYHLSVLPALAFDLSDEDIQQTLPGTLAAFESGPFEVSQEYAQQVDDGQERQSQMSPDLFTTHPENLDDFGLYIKSAMMLSRIHILQGRQFRESLDDEEIRNSKELNVLEAIVVSMKSSALKGRFNLMEQPSSAALSNLYMSHISPYFATILCHMTIADWSNPGCESANKSLAAARSILACTATLRSTSWDCARVDKMATLYWCIVGKILLLALRQAPDSLAPVLRGEILLLR